MRANTTQGDVLIRDRRLWHRGMPNATDEPRHMLALVHGAEDAYNRKDTRKLHFYGDCMAAFQRDSRQVRDLLVPIEPRRRLRPGLLRSIHCKATRQITPET